MLNFQGRISNTEHVMSNSAGLKKKSLTDLSSPTGGQGALISSPPGDRGLAAQKKSRHTAGFNALRFWMINLQNLGYQPGDGCRDAGKQGSAWLFLPSGSLLASCGTGLRARCAIPETSA